MQQTQLLQRAEGAAALLAATLLFGHLHGAWLVFAVLFFVPDVSMLGYLQGPRIGASVYNAFHTYALPLSLGAVGLTFGNSVLQQLALIWTAHIGFDRMLGYGLKLPTGFADTHLGTLSRAKKGEAGSVLH